MAFRKDKTGAAQTAANAAATLVSAFEFKSFDSAVEAYHTLRSEIFEDLGKVVDADNAVFEAAENSSSNGSRSKSSDSGEARSRKTSGGGRSKSKSGKGGGITLDDALNMELNFGVFEGETLGDVLKLTAEQCDDDYSYGDGEREGSDYIKWLAGSSNKNEFVQRRARLIADDEGIEYDD